MRSFLAALLAFGLATSGLAMALSMAKAAQDDPRLDALFVQLKAETDPARAEAIEDDIWHLWTASGDAGIDRLFSKGREALLRGDMEVALAISTEVTGRAPDFAEGWYMGSTIFYQMRDMEYAFNYAKKAVKLEPRHFPALMGIGVIHMQQRQDAEALAALRQALEVDPHLVQAREIADEIAMRLKDKRLHRRQQ